MLEHKENCIRCGAELDYLPEPEKMECIYCHKVQLSQVRCTNGHFICDQCHSKSGTDLVLQVCQNSTETDPYAIAEALFRDKRIHLHGPEHHVLVPAVLIAAYLNQIGHPELKERYLFLAQNRGSKIPGGFCGYAGCCGAGIGVGIFFSIIDQISPLNQEKWGFVNQATGLALTNIGQYSGPRCCKRNTYLAFKTANDLLCQCFGFSLSSKDHFCGWFHKNAECLKEDCAYYPKRSRATPL